MRPDEVKALEELERAWGIKHGPRQPETLSRRVVDGQGIDDGAPPPGFLLVPADERDEFGRPPVQTWPEFVVELMDAMPPLFTTETPWLTAAVCVVTAVCTGAVVLAVWR